MEGMKKEEIPPVVAEQIIKVCKTGETNMFDWHVVRRIAIRNGWNELADYLSTDENWRAYEHFIITGETTPPEKPCGKQLGDAESEKDDEDEGKEVAKDIARRFLVLGEHSGVEIAIGTALSIKTVVKLCEELNMTGGRIFGRPRWSEDVKSEKYEENRDTAKEIAKRFLEMQKYSAKEIALYTGLSLETVLELQAEPWHLLA